MEWYLNKTEIYTGSISEKIIVFPLIAPKPKIVSVVYMFSTPVDAI